MGLYLQGGKKLRGYIEVKGYEGRYLINKKGDVYSLLSNKTLKPCKNNSGYLCVDLRKDNKTKRFFIHRLMGHTYLELKDDLQVNHKNKIRDDNRLNNLEVTTRRGNELHKHRGKKRGVYWSKERKVWHCYLWTGVYNKFIGRFADKEEAHKAYSKAYKKLHGIEA